MSTSTRYHSVDALRGLLLMIMAIDHSSAVIARQHASEFWAGAMSAYTDAFPFLTRWITHLCAPGFFFLMGAGIYWSAAAREHAGNSPLETLRRTVWRGFAIFLSGQVFETGIFIAMSKLKPAAVSLNVISAAPPNDGSSVEFALIVLSGLGLVMMACGLLLRLAPWAWLLVSALCVLATNSLLPSSGRPGAMWEAILLTPGISQHLMAAYPVVPWLAAAAAGMYFAYWWQSDTDHASQRVWMVGGVLVLVGVALRVAGGWGNIRTPRDSGWIEFLNNVKYPPSLVFLCFSLGINLVLLGVLIRLPERFRSGRSPLLVFGQTPLFFYIAHFYLLILCAFVFFKEAASLEGAYVVWAVLLVGLYPLCAWYRRFKMSKPRESLWRMF